MSLKGSLEGQGSSLDSLEGSLGGSPSGSSLGLPPRGSLLEGPSLEGSSLELWREQ